MKKIKLVENKNTNYSKIYKSPSGNMIRYNYDMSELEHITKDGVVIDRVGLYVEDWEDNPQYWVEYWDAELDSFYDGVVSDIMNEAPEDEIPTEDSVEDIENEIEEIQDETTLEVEEELSPLEIQLNELREILPEIDLNLYQITSKEDPNNTFYIIGKVSEDSNDVLMLVKKEVENLNLTEEESEEANFDFVKLPDSIEDITTMSPRYGNDIEEEYPEVLEYLMNILIETDPEKAEALKMEDQSDLDIESETNFDIEELPGEEDENA